jgi:hypothetical protein
MKKIMNYSLLMVLFSFITFSCSKTDMDDLSATMSQDTKLFTKLDKMTLSCVSATGASIKLLVRAGSSGAPAGFSVQWMLKSEYESNGGWPVSSEVVSTSSFCKASFSGVPGSSTFNLNSLGTVEVTIGDVLYDQLGASSPCENMPLECGKDYIFRAFAHNDPRSGRPKSDFSQNQVCSTLQCSTTTGNCTYTQGYWKTHGPTTDCLNGNNTNKWPTEVMSNGLNLDNRGTNYNITEICNILNTPSRGTNLNLAHQLIAALLNVENAASDATIAVEITAAITWLQLYGINGTTKNQELVTALASYNEGGALHPGHCR